MHIWNSPLLPFTEAPAPKSSARPSICPFFAAQVSGDMPWPSAASNICQIDQQETKRERTSPLVSSPSAIRSLIVAISPLRNASCSTVVEMSARIIFFLGFPLGTESCSERRSFESLAGRTGGETSVTWPLSVPIKRPHSLLWPAFQCAF